MWGYPCTSLAASNTGLLKCFCHMLNRWHQGESCPQTTVTAVLTSREVLKEGVPETSVVQSQPSAGKMAVEASEQRESCR